MQSPQGFHGAREGHVEPFGVPSGVHQTLGETRGDQNGGLQRIRRIIDRVGEVRGVALDVGHPAACASGCGINGTTDGLTTSPGDRERTPVGVGPYPNTCRRPDQATAGPIAGRT